MPFPKCEHINLSHKLENFYFPVKITKCTKCGMEFFVVNQAIYYPCGAVKYCEIHVPLDSEYGFSDDALKRISEKYKCKCQ